MVFLIASTSLLVGIVIGYLISNVILDMMYNEHNQRVQKFYSSIIYSPYDKHENTKH